MRFALLCALLLVPSPVLAGDKMPLPKFFYEAKTIAIVNETGYSAIGDNAFDELKKWGRYTIIDDPDQADIVLVLGAREDVTGFSWSGTARTYSSGRTVVGGTAQPITSGKTCAVFAGRDKNDVWADCREWGRWRSATRGIIKGLRSRMEEAEKKK